MQVTTAQLRKTPIEVWKKSVMIILGYFVSLHREALKLLDRAGSETTAQTLNVLKVSVWNVPYLSLSHVFVTCLWAYFNLQTCVLLSCELMLLSPTSNPPQRVCKDIHSGCGAKTWKGYLKGYSSPRNENSAIIFSPSYCVKPLWLSLFC